VISGEGLQEALAGAETIIDTATSPSPDQEGGDHILHRLCAEPSASRRRSRPKADRRRLDHRHRQVPGRLQRGESRAGAGAARRPAPGPDRPGGPVPRVRRSAGRVDDPGWHRPRARDANAARGRPRRRRNARRRGRGVGDRNGRITEVAGPREERLAEVAAALFASRGDSFEIRESRPSVLVPRPGDPDAAAYAEGAALPNPGASSPAPASKNGSRRPRQPGGGRAGHARSGPRSVRSCRAVG
jgi:hypothetical protein